LRTPSHLIFSIIVSLSTSYICRSLEIRSFTWQYWFWATISFTIYSTVYAFRAISTKYIAEKWKYDIESTARLLSMIDVSSSTIKVTSALKMYLLVR
jgi:hypothetical protein